MLPSVTEYRDALLFEGALKKYENLVLVKDSTGDPIFSSGNFAAVFKMQDKHTQKRYALKCFTRDQELRNESYRLISKQLNGTNHPYMVHYEYLNDEIWVNSQLAGDGEFPVLLMEWIESQTLGEYLSILCKNDNKAELFKLACTFDQMAIWLLEQPFAHGDLKTDNILVEPNGHLRLIDYDGMFTPEMAGQQARENGSPGFRHPARTQQLFGSFIDDFSILLLSLSLHALAYDPSLGKDKNFGDAILLNETDLLQPSVTKTWESLDQLRSNHEIAGRLVMLYMCTGNPPETRLFGIKQLLQTCAELTLPLPENDFFRLKPFCNETKWGFKDQNGNIAIPCIYNWVQTYCSPLYNSWASISMHCAHLALSYKVFDSVNSKSEVFDMYRMLLDRFLVCQYPYNGKDLVKRYLIGEKSIEVSEFELEWKNALDMLKTARVNAEKVASERLSEIVQFQEIPDQEGHILSDVLKSIASSSNGGKAKESISKNLAIVQKDKKWGVIDITGKEITSIKYDGIRLFQGGFAVAKLNNKYGFIHQSGREIIPFVYNYISDFLDGLAEVRLNEKWGFIDATGKVVIPVIYEQVSSFSNGIANVILNGKYCFINQTGNEISKNYCGGLALINWNEKFGFIDQNGNMVIPFKYDYAESFINDLSIVRLKGKYGLISKSGEEIIPIIYDKIRRGIVGFHYELNGQKGAFNKTTGKKIS